MTTAWGVDLQNLFQTVEPFLPAHHIAAEVHVEQDDVGVEGGDEVLQPVGAGDDLYLLGIGFQQQVQGEEHVFVIVYNQYFT